MATDADSRSDEDHIDAPDSDEEEVEQEWHFWLLGLLVLAGITLVVFRPGIWPNMGFAILAIAAVGWLLKETLERMM